MLQGALSNETARTTRLVMTLGQPRVRSPNARQNALMSAKDCLQAAEKTEDPLAREMLLRHALEWMRDGLAASKHSKLCAVCGRKAAPGSSLVH
jgi:hypothetical protein